MRFLRLLFGKSRLSLSPEKLTYGSFATTNFTDAFALNFVVKSFRKTYFYLILRKMFCSNAFIISHFNIFSSLNLPLTSVANDIDSNVISANYKIYFLCLCDPFQEQYLKFPFPLFELILTPFLVVIRNLLSPYERVNICLLLTLVAPNNFNEPLFFGS